MTTGQMIQIIRKEKRLTQAQLAERAGIAVNSLRLYEAGKRSPKMEVLERIASALSVNVVDLYESNTPQWVDSKIKELRDNPRPTESVRSVEIDNIVRYTVSLNSQLDNHFRAYILLNDTQRKVIDTITDTFNEKKP